MDGDPTVDGVYEPTVSSFDTYNEQQAACKAEGKRLCTLDELCPTQGVLGFDIRGNNGDSWVAYDGTDTCGCADNAWVQIGNWGGLGHTCKTHCEVTAEFYDAPPRALKGILQTHTFVVPCIMTVARAISGNRYRIMSQVS